MKIRFLRSDVATLKMACRTSLMKQNIMVRPEYQLMKKTFYFQARREKRHHGDQGVLDQPKKPFGRDSSIELIYPDSCPVESGAAAWVLDRCFGKRRKS